MPDDPVETGATPVETPPAPTGPLTREQALKNATTAASQRAAQATAPVEAPPAETPPAEPVKETPEPGKEPAEPGKETVAEPTPGETKPEAEPATGIQVELPAGHPAAQGLAHITVQTETEERVLRGLLNSAYVRRPQLEAEVQRRQSIEQQNQTLFKQNRELREKVARFEATETARGKWEESPEYRQRLGRYEQLKAAEEQGSVPEGTAAEYKQAMLERGYDTVAERDFQERVKQIDADDQAEVARQNEEAGRLFLNDAWQRANGQWPDFVTRLSSFEQNFRTARDEFDFKLRAGHYPDYRPGDLPTLHRLFAEHLKAVLSRDPAVRAAYKEHTDRLQADKDAAAKAAAEKDQERERMREEVRKQMEAEAQERRSAVPPNPVAGLPSAVRTRAPGEGTSGTDTDSAPQTPQEIRKRALQQSIESARKRAGVGG